MGPTALQGHDVPPLLPRESRETLRSKPQQASDTMEGLKGGQKGQGGQQRIHNRSSGQKFPLASVPKVKLPPQRHTLHDVSTRGL